MQRGQHLLGTKSAPFLLTLILFWGWLHVAPAYAATIAVDGVVCSLADAITAANTDTATGGCSTGSAADTLSLSSGATYILTAALPSIASAITVAGNGATITRSGAAPSFAIFDVSSAGAFTLTNATISNGAEGGIYNGGGALNVIDSSIVNNTGFNGGGIGGSGTTSIVRSVISGNTADNFGGGVDLQGTLEITDTLIVSNTAPAGSGGGVIVAHSVTPARIVNSTIANNTGGGVLTAYNGRIVLINSTVSGNDIGVGFSPMAEPGPLTAISLQYVTVTANGMGIEESNDFCSSSTCSFTYAASIVVGNTTADCAVTNITPTSGGYNLVGDTTACNATATGDTATTDPLLGPLQNNGGPTPTHAVLSGSPAIEQIPVGTLDCKGTITADQRGAVRANGTTQGGSACEIGAYEFSSGTPTSVKLASFAAVGSAGSASGAYSIAMCVTSLAAIAAVGGLRRLR